MDRRKAIASLLTLPTALLAEGVELERILEAIPLVDIGPSIRIQDYLNPCFGSWEAWDSQ